MRRIIALILSLMLLLLSCALGEGISALELAEEIARRVDGISEICGGEAIDGALECAIWTDGQTDAACSVLRYANAQDALNAAILNAGASKLVRSAGEYNLYLGNRPDVQRADDYEAALREILGMGAREGADYILNVNTRRFHLPGCVSVKKMNESNKFAYVGAREAVIKQGYEACKRCKP